MKKYLVQYMIETDETIVDLMTEGEIVKLLKDDNVADFLYGIWIFDVSVAGFAKPMQTSDFWEPGPFGVAHVNDSDYYDMIESLHE